MDSDNTQITRVVSQQQQGGVWAAGAVHAKKHLPGEEIDSVLHIKAPQLKSILTVAPKGGGTHAGSVH